MAKGRLYLGPAGVINSSPLSALSFWVSLLPGTHGCSTFFTIPLSLLHHSSQPLFAFTWMDPDTCQSQQLTWTVLPQGFRDSPNFFGQALQRALQTLDLGSTILLQYVDNLLVRNSSLHNCLVHTATLLNVLGYRILLSKAQIASTAVNYMGLLLTSISKIIPAQRLRVLTQTPRPQTKRELHCLLGLFNFFLNGSQILLSTQNPSTKLLEET